MSKVNFNRNVFLEKEELVNFQSFLSNNLFFKILLEATATFGIVTNDPAVIKGGEAVTPQGITANSPFLVQQGSVMGSIKVLSGLALNKNGQIINIDLEDNILVPKDSLYYWVKIAYASRNYEDGLVSINTQGFVSGSVDFSGKVRGQSTSTPVCIRFVKEDGSIPLNNGNYQIVSVIDNQNLILTSATTFVAEANLRPIILGTLPIGGRFTQDQLNGLYQYDSYTITLVQETEVNTPPEKDENEFYIARVSNSNNTLVIDNSKKSEFWSLGNIRTV